MSSLRAENRALTSERIRSLLEELHACHGKPRYTRLEEAKAAVAGCPRGRQRAFETLIARGLLPADWIGAPHRRFREGPRWAEPCKSTHIVALAADLEGVLAAEELAKEYLRRLVAFDGSPTLPSVVCWNFQHMQAVARCRNYRCYRHEEFYKGRYARLYHQLASAVAPLRVREMFPAEIPVGMCSPVGRTSGGWGYRRNSVFYADFYQHVYMLAGIEHGVVLRRKIPRENWWRYPTGQQEQDDDLPLADVPDPTEVLLQLWRLGYALRDFNASRIELVAPLISL